MILIEITYDCLQCNENNLNCTKSNQWRIRKKFEWGIKIILFDNLKKDTLYNTYENEKRIQESLNLGYSGGN